MRTPFATVDSDDDNDSENYVDDIHFQDVEQGKEQASGNHPPINPKPEEAQEQKEGQQEQQPQDSQGQGWDQERERPIVLILGLTGAGKTTFLNHVAGAELPVAIDADMEPCTTAVQTAVATFGDFEVLLVDTPGFDDPNKSEARILIDVAEWIKNNLRGQRKVTAALYLHSIETKKMYGSNLRNFHLFANIVGSSSMKNVGLITTHWDTVPRETATSREAQLSAKAWSIYRQHGARTYRTDNSRQSCRAIVRQLLELHPTFLQIQEEMTRGKKDLRSTEAGKHVIKEVEQRILDEKEYIAQLKTRLKEVDGEEKEEIQKLIAQAEALLCRYYADLEEVKHIPGWGEWTADLVKTQGPALAGNLAINIITARSNGNALAAANSKIGTLLQHNTLLQKTAADATAAAAQNAANVLPHRVAMGVASGGTYWGLEKAFEIGKWAVPKIAGALLGGGG